MITYEQVSELLSYDPDTGIVTRKVRTSNRIKVGDVFGHQCKVRGGEYICLVGKLLGKTHKVHRIAWLLSYGKWPECEIDHINQNPLDNRICNLRDVLPEENTRNYPIRKDNTSGTIGVSWRKDRGMWIGRVYCKKVFYHLGYFNEKQDAVDAVLTKRKELGFHENHGKKRKVNQFDL